MSIAILDKKTKKEEEQDGKKVLGKNDGTKLEDRIKLNCTKK